MNHLSSFCASSFKNVPQPVIFYQIILPFSVIRSCILLSPFPSSPPCVSTDQTTLYSVHQPPSPSVCTSRIHPTIPAWTETNLPIRTSFHLSILSSHPIIHTSIPLYPAFCFILLQHVGHFSTVGDSIPGVLLEQNLLIVKLHTRPP